MRLNGKSVLVTGATGGLGQAIARRMKAEGCTLTLTGRRADVLEPLAAELGATSLVADLSDVDAVTRVAEAAQDTDVLVANAGVPGGGLLDELTVEQIDRVLDVNLRAPIMLTRLLGEHMLRRGTGHVVLMSSLSGKSATPYTSMYNATKFALRGFALGLRADWEPRGVGVSCVNPGPIADAGMFHDGGTKLPSWVKQRKPADVAAGVVRAVEQNRAEVDVADLVTRVAATVGMLAPQTSAKISKRVGADRIARDLAESHKDKR
ncbi:MAG: SDR family NAD(P)-dependent oxidoreductase [Labedaea sp.]